MFKGDGHINNEEYKFILTAVDGNLKDGDGLDKFRIRIWSEDDQGIETVIYDNQIGSDLEADLTAIIEGGSIVIHKK